MNRPKARGTAAETAVVRYVQTAGFPFAERLTLTGRYDRGDVSLLPGRAVIVEVKHSAAACAGQPPAGLLAGWMAETEVERVNAGADHALLVAKRSGTTDVGRWWCWVRAATFAALVGAPVTHQLPDPATPLCTSVASALALLRAAGYGEPWEGVA